MFDTLCCYANTIKRFLVILNNIDYLWKVSRPEFHFWRIFMKFQQQEVQWHMQSTNFLDRPRMYRTVISPTETEERRHNFIVDDSLANNGPI